MKRLLSTVLTMLLLTVFICGCGCDDGVVEDKETDIPVISPGIEAVPSPDMDNGTVNGGDEDTADTEQGGKGSASDKKSDLEEDVLISPNPASDMPA